MVIRKYSYRFDVNSNLSRTELSFDRGFHRVSKLVRGLDRRSTRDRNGYFGEELSGGGRSGPNRSHITNLGHAKDHASQLPRIDRSLVDENRKARLALLDGNQKARLALNGNSETKAAIKDR